MTRIQVICVLFISTIFAEQSSMVAAIAQSIDIRVIFAINQEMILILCNETFDNVIRLDKYSLVSLNRVIVFAMTSCTFELAFLCKPLLCILRILNHFCCYTLSACSASTTKHHNRLSCSQVEPVLAIETVQFHC